eukprot:s5425_g1.t1
MALKPPAAPLPPCRRQIHIPKLGIHGRLEPRDLDDDGLPDDLQLLKALQAQEKKQIERLEHSNGQLKEFLAQEDDPDFREALVENLEILVRKHKRLAKIAEKIFELTPPQPAAPVATMEEVAGRNGRQAAPYAAPAAGPPGPAVVEVPAGLDL